MYQNECVNDFFEDEDEECPDESLEEAMQQEAQAICDAASEQDMEKVLGHISEVAAEEFASEDRFEEADPAECKDLDEMLPDGVQLLDLTHESKDSSEAKEISGKADFPKTLREAVASPNMWAGLWQLAVQLRCGENGMDAKWTSGYPFDEDKLFRILKDRLIDKHVLSCRIYAHDKSVEAKLPNGLVCNHAYALLQVLEETLDNGDPVKLVQCRNPWGTGEWKGDWADFAPELTGRWQENPRLQQRLEVGRKNNGSFFMSFEEFSGSFNRIYVCPCGDRPIEAEELAEEAEGEEHPGFLSRFFSWSAGLSQSILNS
eukprot:g32497.t1